MAARSTISMNIDQYGKYARASALADFVELAALRAGTFALADLDLALERAGWYRQRRGLFTVNPDVDLGAVEDLELGDGTEDPDDPDWGDWVRTILRQRSRVLGEEYPFKVSRDYVVASPGRETCDYVRLLIVTICHAYGARKDVVEDPRKLFELMIVSTFSAIGFASVGMGTATTQGKKFKEQLRLAATAVGLIAATEPYPAKVNAKDGGVDAIGVLNWNDLRPGQIVFLAQATLATSLDWEKKIREPRVDHWAAYLNERFHPLAMLAVPHHIEDEHFGWLVSPSATIVDRLRLVGRLGPVLDGEDDLRRWAMETELVY